MARMTGRLMEALTSLFQAGERFVGSAAMSGQRVVRAGDLGEIRARRSLMIQSESTADGAGCTPGRNSEWMERQGPTGQEREDDIGTMGERRRALEDSEYVRGGQGSLERYGGLPRVVLLTPEGGQLINIGIGRGFVFSVVSQKTARYAMHRSKLPEPVMVTGPAGQQVRDRTLHHGLPTGEGCGWKAGHLCLRGGHAGGALRDARRWSAEMADAAG
jgi:hypothetical protein